MIRTSKYMVGLCILKNVYVRSFTWLRWTISDLLAITKTSWKIWKKTKTIARQSIFIEVKYICVRGKTYLCHSFRFTGVRIFRGTAEILRKKFFNGKKHFHNVNSLGKSGADFFCFTFVVFRKKYSRAWFQRSILFFPS